MIVGEITLDLDNLTLGQMEDAETASGMSFSALLNRGTGTRKLLAVFLHECVPSASAQQKQELWQRLRNLRLSDAPSLPSPSSPAGTPETSAT